MPSAAEYEPTLGLFELSRIDAQAVCGEVAITARRGRPAGMGVMIDARCDGAALSVWAADADWCAWLAPHWPVPAFAQLPAEYLPLAGALTLAPLSELAQSAGQAPATIVGLQAAPAPIGRCWLLRLQTRTRRLPLYIQAADGEWLAGVLTAMQPQADRWLTLAIGPGWCLPPDPRPAAGDALAIVGAGEALDRFWLNPARPMGQLLFERGGQARLADAAAADTWQAGWAVEVAQIELRQDEVWPWRPGTVVTRATRPYPVARLCSDGEPVAQGSLLRLADGWAVRIDVWRES